MSFKTLGEVCDKGDADVQTGPFGSQLHESDYVDEGVPVVMPKDIHDGRIDEASVARVTEHKASSLPRHFLQAGDIVLPRRGEISKRALITEEQSGYLCGTGCVRIRLSNGSVHSQFLYYYLDQPHIIQWIEQRAIGSTMLNLNTSIIKAIPLPPIPFDTQRRIASILSSYDDLIENNRKRIKLLERAARLLYKEWFVRLRFPGCEGVKVKDGVPEGWEKKRLDELASVVMGQSPPSTTYNNVGDGLPFHQGVTDYGDRFVEHRMYCTAPTRFAEAMDILLSVRAPVGRLNITMERIAIGRGLSAVRSRTGHQTHLFYQLGAHFHKEDLIGGGAIYASVAKNELFGQLLITPRAALIKQFEEIVTPIDAQIRNLTLQNAALTRARDLLLPRLMSGKVKV